MGATEELMRSGLHLLHLAPILLTVVLLLGAASGSGKRVPSGSWGGRGVGMNVTEEGASIEFDCAHASLEGAIALEADGSFHSPGAYFQERPGPQKVEEEEKGRAARFRPSASASCTA